MFKINIKQLFLLIFVGIIATSCDNDSNPVAADDPVDADGFILESNETEMYREFQGAVVVNNLNLTTTNTLELSVHFLDSEEEEIVHEEEHEMEIEITGVAAGTTTFSMELWHDGHIDWTSTNLIQITVTE